MQRFCMITAVQSKRVPAAAMIAQSSGFLKCCHDPMPADVLMILLGGRVLINALNRQECLLLSKIGRIAAFGHVSNLVLENLP